MGRPDWNTYFLDIAAVVATRATCPRKQVGAVLVDAEHRIIATGYNGAPSGDPHCFDEGCLIYEDEDHYQHCGRATHAETNAVATARFAGQTERLKGATCYTTITPCPGCAYQLEYYGVTTHIWREDYP